MARFLILSLLVLLAGCSFRGNLARLPADQEPAALRDVYFATNRGFDALPFGGDRGKRLIFGQAVVTIPPIHEPGEIEWPRGEPDPAKHFLIERTEAYSDAEGFRRSINRALAKRPRGERDVVLYVHGFNSRFADSLYRIAQITHDLSVPGIAVQYSWPSAGNPLGYAYDRDSALFARDDLERLLNTLTQTNAENVVVVAHSLGSLLTMETLRQMKLRSGPRAMSRLGGVVLMSPDVDLDVFKSQVRSIQTLPKPFIVFSSQNDRALRLVERLTGQHSRLGRLTQVDNELSEYKITFVDVSAFNDGDAFNHFATARSPALLKLLGQVADFDTAFSGDGARTGLLPGTALSVQNTTRIILTPVSAQ